MTYLVFFIIAVVLLLILGVLWVFRRRASPTAPAEPPPPAVTAEQQQHFAQRQQQLAAIAQENNWTEAAYAHVLDGQIAPGMTQDMVLLAWGGPTTIDHRTTNQKGVPVERWIYQMPITNALQYVWFADGRVVRVEEG